MPQKRFEGAQALAAVVAVVVLAITVPLFGLLILPVVALAVPGRALLKSAGEVVAIK